MEIVFVVLVLAGIGVVGTIRAVMTDDRGQIPPERGYDTRRPRL